MFADRMSLVTFGRAVPVILGTGHKEAVRRSEEMEFAAVDYSLPFTNSQRDEMGGKL